MNKLGGERGGTGEVGGKPNGFKGCRAVKTRKTRNPWVAVLQSAKEKEGKANNATWQTRKDPEGKKRHLDRNR